MDSLLSTLASVAASLVGFAALLTAFRAANERLSAYDSNNVRSLIICSVSALLFALLPLPFATTGSHHWLWSPLTILLGANLLLWAVQSPRWMKRKRLQPGRPLLYAVMLGLQALLGSTLIAGAILLSDATLLYGIGVLWFLIAALVVFVVQIFQLLPVEPSPPTQ